MEVRLPGTDQHKLQLPQQPLQLADGDLLLSGAALWWLALLPWLRGQEGLLSRVLVSIPAVGGGGGGGGGGRRWANICVHQKKDPTPPGKNTKVVAGA